MESNLDEQFWTEALAGHVGARRYSRAIETLEDLGFARTKTGYLRKRGRMRERVYQELLDRLEDNPAALPEVRVFIS